MTRFVLLWACLALAACSGGAVHTMPLPGVTPAGGGASTPTPILTPTPAPTPSPTPVPLTESPSLALTQTGAASFTVTEAGYRGQYTVQSSNTAIATVTSPVVSSSDTTTIALDALAPGPVTITVTDAGGQSVAEPVGITITPVTIQQTGARR